MLELIVLFLPALLMTVWKCKLKSEWGGQRDYRKLLIEYFCNVLLLNFLVITVAYTFFGSKGGVVENLNKYTGFAFRYLCLAIFLAVVLPYLKYRKKAVSFRIDKTGFSLRKWQNCSLYLYAFVLFCLNLSRCFDNVIWGDEGYTIRLAQMTVPQFLTETAADVHPPLYYFLTWAFQNLFGGGYHLATLLTYGIILVIGITWIRKRFGTWNAALFVTLATFMENAVTYNVEIRMYSMAAMFVLLAFIELYEILHRFEWKNFLLFTVFSLGAAYTHYYALFTVAFFYLFLLGLSIRRRDIFGKVIVSCVLTVVGYLPWLAVFLSALGEKVTSSWWLGTYTTVRDCLGYIYYGPLKKELFFFYVALLVVVFIKESKVIAVSTDKKDSKWNIAVKLRNPESTPFIEWIFAGQMALFGTMALGIIASLLIRPVFILRYLFPALGIAWLVLPACISKVKWKSLIAFFLVGVILFTYVPKYNEKISEERFRKESTEKALTETADISPEDSLLVTDIVHIDWTIFAYYYPGVSHVLINNLDEIQKMSESKNIWLFMGTEIDENTMADYEKKGYSLERIHEGYLGDRWLWIYKVN